MTTPHPDQRPDPRLSPRPGPPSGPRPATDESGVSAPAPGPVPATSEAGAPAPAPVPDLVARARDLRGRPLAEHADTYDEIHAELHRSLAGIDTR